MSLYFRDGGIAILHGDACAELAGFEKRSVDAEYFCVRAPGEGDLRVVVRGIHFIFDPPYSAHVHTKSRSGDGKKVSKKKDLGFDPLKKKTRLEIAAHAKRLATRWVIAFCDMEGQYLWQRDLERAGLDHARFGVWHKLGATPQFTGDRPATACEAIEIAHAKGRKRWNGGGKHGLWAYPVVSDQRPHTTQKPVELMRALIRDFTDEGDLIIDPFMGSGTTLIAARDMGRQAIGIERSLEYCQTAKRRLDQLLLPFEGVAHG